MKTNKWVLLGFSVIVLFGCGKSNNPTSTQQQGSTLSQSCAMTQSIKNQVDEHRTHCSSTGVKTAALQRYYSGLKSLEGVESKQIARELITLRSWTQQITTLSTNDTACAVRLLCRGDQ
jgi:hypothetical protein